MFGQHAYRDFEKLTGLNLLVPKPGNDFGTYQAMHAIVFVGLKWGLYKGDGIEPKPKFTIIQVADWCEQDDKTAGEIIKKFQESYLTDRSKNAGAGGNPA